MAARSMESQHRETLIRRSFDGAGALKMRVTPGNIGFIDAAVSSSNKQPQHRPLNAIPAAINRRAHHEQSRAHQA